jgi:hypothetical protein
VLVSFLPSSLPSFLPSSLPPACLPPSSRPPSFSPSLLPFHSCLPFYLPTYLLIYFVAERHTYVPTSLNPSPLFPIPPVPDVPTTPLILRNMVRNSICRMTMHGKWWINDPDCILLRKSTNYSDAEILGIATVKAMSGEWR